MEEVLISLAVWMIGSALALLIVTVAYLPVVKTRETYQDHRDVLALGTVLVLGLIILAGLGEKLWDATVTWGDVFVLPLMAAWMLGVFFLGLYLAARIRGVLKNVVQ